MSIMEVDGYKAVITYDQDLNSFRGEILGLNGGADFYGCNPEELKKEFKISLEEFLATCEEQGINWIDASSDASHPRANDSMPRDRDFD